MTNTATARNLRLGQTVDLTLLARPGDTARCAAQAVEGSPAAVLLTGTATVTGVHSVSGRGGRHYVVVHLDNGEKVSLGAKHRVPLAD